jgi:hypothetical protein
VKGQDIRWKFEEGKISFYLSDYPIHFWTIDIIASKSDIEASYLQKFPHSAYAKAFRETKISMWDYLLSKRVDLQVIADEELKKYNEKRKMSLECDIAQQVRDNIAAKEQVSSPSPDPKPTEKPKKPVPKGGPDIRVGDTVRVVRNTADAMKDRKLEYLQPGDEVIVCEVDNDWTHFSLAGVKPAIGYKRISAQEEVAHVHYLPMEDVERVPDYWMIVAKDGKPWHIYKNGNLFSTIDKTQVYVRDINEHVRIGDLVEYRGRGNRPFIHYRDHCHPLDLVPRAAWVPHGHIGYEIGINVDCYHGNLRLTEIQVLVRDRALTAMASENSKTEDPSRKTITLNHWLIEQIRELSPSKWAIYHNGEFIAAADNDYGIIKSLWQENDILDWWSNNRSIYPSSQIYRNVKESFEFLCHANKDSTIGLVDPQTDAERSHMSYANPKYQLSPEEWELRRTSLLKIEESRKSQAQEMIKDLAESLPKVEEKKKPYVPKVGDRVRVVKNTSNAYRPDNSSEHLEPGDEVVISRFFDDEKTRVCYKMLGGGINNIDISDIEPV